ncbi:MAG: hypothetical protein ILP12_08070 [Lachnospiraceae bacterium]|nr:hypothetical protein [Lachnospiraceae bacterium]
MDDRMDDPKKEVSAEELGKALIEGGSGELEQFFSDYETMLQTWPKPFAHFMRECLAKNALRQQEVFLAADIPEKYGYKLLSEEKHTRKRDVILRLCYGARLTLEEARIALTLARFPDLYPRLRRDAILIVAFHERKRVDAVNQMLAQYGCEGLESCGKEKE